MSDELKNSNLILVYNNLRQEIMYAIGIQDKLFMFAFTSIATILGAASQLDNPFIYLLSFVILIPTRCRYIWHYAGMCRISSYMIVFLESELEGINWETDGNQLSRRVGQKPFIRTTFIQYFASSILGIISYLLYCYKLPINTSFYYILLIIPLIPLIYLMYIDIYYFKTAPKQAKKYIELWQEYKQ